MAAFDRTARLWSADGQGEPIVLKGHSGDVRFAAWSAPRSGDFHALERFGRVSLVATLPNAPTAPGIVIAPGTPEGAAQAQPVVQPVAPPGRLNPAAINPTALQNAARALRNAHGAAAPH